MRSLLCAAAVGGFEPDSGRWTFSTPPKSESGRFTTARCVGVWRDTGWTERVGYVADRELLTPPQLGWRRLVLRRVSEWLRDFMLGWQLVHGCHFAILCGFV